MLALGRLLRVSLSPSAAADAACGVLLGAAVWPGGTGPWLQILAALCVYHGGMALNDVVDAAWDRDHKRERPIARGTISTNTALGVSAGCLFGGVALAVLPGFESSALGLDLFAGERRDHLAQRRCGRHPALDRYRDISER